jgi:hypothetical protein
MLHTGEYIEYKVKFDDVPGGVVAIDFDGDANAEWIAFDDGEYTVQAVFVPYADVLVEVTKNGEVIYLDAFFTEETPPAFYLLKPDEWETPVDIFRDILVNLSVLIHNDERLANEIDKRAWRMLEHIKERFTKTPRQQQEKPLA